MNPTEEDVKQIREDIKKEVLLKEIMKKYRITVQAYQLIKSQIPESELPKKHKDEHELTEDEARAIVEDLNNGVLVEDIMRKRKITIYQIVRAQGYMEFAKLRYHGTD